MRFEATDGTRTAVVEVRADGGAFTALVDGREVAVEILAERGAMWTVRLDGRRVDVGMVRQGAGYTVDLHGRSREVGLQDAVSATAGPHPRAATGPARVTAPMPGRVVRVLVSSGDDVRAGQGLLVMEAMKMENEIRSPRDGRVREIAVGERQAVETGALLATLEPLQT